MKVLFLTKYTRQGASSRLRTFQYLDFFRAQGVMCEVQSFFSEAYLAEVYRTKHHNKLESAKSFFRRFFKLFTVGRYDCVVIEKELFPFLPAVCERCLALLGVKYIVDYDDAIFHNYDLHPNPMVRFLLKNKIKTVMRLSTVVVAGNDYIRSRALAWGAKRVELIPTVIDMEKYDARGADTAGAFTIGWIGSPITFKYIHPLKPVFERLAASHDIQLKFIGANKGLGVPYEELVPWQEIEEARQIRSFDVGIMPLEDNIWENGKCGYKLIQYMGSAVPVVGTPIGVNDTIIEEGINGYKATSLDEWYEQLEKLIRASAEERHRLGLQGREKVKRAFSLQVAQREWMRIMTSLTQRPGRHGGD